MLWVTAIELNDWIEFSGLLLLNRLLCAFSLWRYLQKGVGGGGVLKNGNTKFTVLLVVNRYFNSQQRAM